MVSARLDAMITDPVERTYLDVIDGVWADLVLNEFAFLEERGGRLDHVSFHQNGDGIAYVGAWGVVTLVYMLDYDPPVMGGMAQLRQVGDYVIDLDTIVRERAPDTELPPYAPRDPVSVAANLRVWADVLRSATDLF